MFWTMCLPMQWKLYYYSDIVHFSMHTIELFPNQLAAPRFFLHACSLVLQSMTVDVYVPSEKAHYNDFNIHMLKYIYIYIYISDVM